MATINAVRTEHDDGRTVSVSWTNLVQATSDVGAGAMVGDLDRLDIQAFGTNATTVEIQGSNDGTNWNALGAGVTLTVGASGSSPVTSLAVRPRFLRPNTPSAGADTDVVVVGRRI